MKLGAIRFKSFKLKSIILVGVGSAVIASCSSVSGMLLASNTVAPPSNLYGCVQSGTRTLTGVFTVQGNFKGCTNGFPVTVTSGTAHGLTNALADGPYPGATKLTLGSNSTSEWANNGTLQTSWVACPAGDVALGGGFGPNGDLSTAPNANDGKVTVISSAPDYINGTTNVALGSTNFPKANADGAFQPNGWAVQGYNNGAAPVVVRPWVICAKVG